MRATVDIQEDLLREAKALAARSGRTLDQVVDDALRALFQRIQAGSSAEPPKLPTYGGGGLQPGVALAGSAVLLDVMERDS
jgi:hypothetical protein